jgi:hypothetical protein
MMDYFGILIAIVDGLTKKNIPADIREEILFKYFDAELERLFQIMYGTWLGSYEKCCAEYHLRKSDIEFENNRVFVLELHNENFAHDNIELLTSTAFIVVLNLSKFYCPNRRWEFYERAIADPTLYEIGAEMQNEMIKNYEEFPLDYAICDVVGLYSKLANTNDNLYDSCQAQFLFYYEDGYGSDRMIVRATQTGGILEIFPY